MTTLITQPTMNDLNIESVPVAQKFTVPYVGNLPVEQRMAVIHALANDAGLRLPDTRLPEGTALLPIGEESRRAMKADLNKLPDLHPGLYGYRARLLAESAVDSKVPTRDVRMNVITGGLFGKDKAPDKAIGYTADGFAQVAQFIKPQAIRNGFSENMLALPPKLRSEVFNHWSVNSTRDENVVMRTFNGGNGRLIRAVTSEKHSLETGDDRAIVDSLLALPPGAKLRATREPGGRYSEMEVIWPMLDRELRVGDLAYGGIRITNSETKGSALRVEAFVLRVLCYNFTTAFSEDFEADELSLKHVGDLTRRLPNMVRRAQERIEPLVLAFGDAYKEPLPGMFATRGEALERVGKVFMLPTTTLERAAALWDADGMKSAGDTRAGLVHALTRASQEEGISAAGNTERAAGRIIMDGWDALS